MVDAATASSAGMHPNPTGTPYVFPYPSHAPCMSPKTNTSCHGERAITTGAVDPADVLHHLPSAAQAANYQCRAMFHTSTARALYVQALTHVLRGSDAEEGDAPARDTLIVHQAAEQGFKTTIKPVYAPGAQCVTPYAWQIYIECALEDALWVRGRLRPHLEYLGYAFVASWRVSGTASSLPAEKQSKAHAVAAGMERARTDTAHADTVPSAAFPKPAVIFMFEFGSYVNWQEMHAGHNASHNILEASAARVNGARKRHRDDAAHTATASHACQTTQNDTPTLNAVGSASKSGVVQKPVWRHPDISRPCTPTS